MEHIYLESLAKAHDSLGNRRHQLIIQDLFYLCTNESFINSISKIRNNIIEKLINVGIESPSLPTDLEKITRKYRKTIYDNNLWEWYRDELILIAELHDYYGQSFLDDYITDKVSRDAGYKLILSDFEELNVLENIIFFNDPMWPKDTFPRVPFRSRAGHLSIDYNIYRKYIKAEFDLGTDRRTMIRIIEKDFDTIANLQEEEYRIPNIRREVDNKLFIKCKVFELQKQGRTPTQISITLESLYPTQEITQDKVKKILARIKEKQIRFNI